MKKRLITVKNLSEFVQNKELVVQADMIITPGAKDMIREQGVEVRYEKSFCESNCESENKVKNEIKKVIDWEKVDKKDYLLAMERSPIKDTEIKMIFCQSKSITVKTFVMY